MFEFRADDGDKVYDAIADGPVLFTGTATYGFLAWTPPGPGFYRVTEVTPPAGLHIAEPVLVPDLIKREPAKCVQVPEQSPGLHQGSATPSATCSSWSWTRRAARSFAATNPPTSTVPAPEPASSHTPGFPALLAIGGLGLALALLARPRSRHRPAFD